jgi:hypothetical protein
MTTGEGRAFAQMLAFLGELEASESPHVYLPPTHEPVRVFLGGVQHAEDVRVAIEPSPIDLSGQALLATIGVGKVCRQSLVQKMERPVALSGTQRFEVDRGSSGAIREARPPQSGGRGSVWACW